MAAADAGWGAAAPLLDVLIPGDARFPCASSVLAGVPILGLGEADRAWLAAASQRIAALSPPARTAETERLAAAEPAIFARVWAAVTAAYYRTDTVHAAAVALAATAPAEPGAHFDETLVRKVRADRPGAARRPDHDPRRPG